MLQVPPMLDRLIPDLRIVATHPMYQLEARRLRRRTIPRLPGFSAQWMLRVAAVIVAFWAIFVFQRYTQYRFTATSTYYGLPIPTRTSYDIMQTVFFISLGLSILLDFISVLVSVNSISREKITTAWDLIHMTNLHPFGVIRTKHTLSQIRAWRSMIIVMGLRIAVLVLLVLHSTLLPANDYSRQTILASALEYLWDYPIEATVQLLIFGVFVIVYVFDPLWRMQTVTAMGTAISARGWQITTSFLAGFAAVLLMWISQAVMLGLTFWLTILIAQSGLGGIQIYSDVIWTVIGLMYVSMLAAMVYFHYRFLRERSLKNAAKAAFRT